MGAIEKILRTLEKGDYIKIVIELINVKNFYTGTISENDLQSEQISFIDIQGNPIGSDYSEIKFIEIKNRGNN